MTSDTGNASSRPGEAEARSFGARRIYYNNFAAHLLNAYNPNLLYPDLPHRWSDGDWFATLEMVAAFGFNVFEFWLVPRLFCREGIESDFGQAFVRQMNAVIDHAHRLGVRVEMLCGLATIGSDWRTACPNVLSEWAEARRLWEAWTKALPELDIVGIFPGDPGACSRNGCTAETFVDKALEVALAVEKNLPAAEIEVHTWGPPFFGWGNIQGPPGWAGEFVQSFQGTAWAFDKRRADRAMEHLLRRLPDFPEETAVAINMGFNPDGIPRGEEDARPWAREIARTHRILTWDFSLTEGENAVLPHYRFERLFARRREEREAAPYSGGICYTMTPRLNQLSLYEAARSFQAPEENPHAVAREFLSKVFGDDAGGLAEFLPLFEVVPDWGHYVALDLSREAYHARMRRMVDLLESLRGHVNARIPVHPAPEAQREELLFFARLFADLSAPSPDYDALRRRYWNRVYGIYDLLPEHVDPRPRHATDNLIRHFRTWGRAADDAPVAGKWVD